MDFIFLYVFELADIHSSMQINFIANGCFVKPYEQVLKAALGS